MSVANKNNKLYIVNYDKPLGRAYLGPDENERMMTFVNSLDYKEVNFLNIASLAQVLGYLKQRTIPCKLLLGIDGILKKQDMFTISEDD